MCWRSVLSRLQWGWDVVSFSEQRDTIFNDTVGMKQVNVGSTVFFFFAEEATDLNLSDIVYVCVCFYKMCSL